MRLARPRGAVWLASGGALAIAATAWWCATSSFAISAFDADVSGIAEATWDPSIVMPMLVLAALGAVAAAATARALGPYGWIGGIGVAWAFGGAAQVVIGIALMFLYAPGMVQILGIVRFGPLGFVVDYIGWWPAGAVVLASLATLLGTRRGWAWPVVAAVLIAAVYGTITVLLARNASSTVGNWGDIVLIVLAGLWLVAAALARAGDAEAEAPQPSGTMPLRQVTPLDGTFPSDRPT